jgi:dCMP deaminase
MKRKSWDEYFMDIARAVGTRGTCDRGRSGSIIVKNKRILSTGYVGSGPGMAHCDDEGHYFREVYHSDGSVTKHCVRTIHAEINAMIQAAKFGVSIEGGTVYCKMTPCLDCAKAVIAAGIVRVVAEKAYHADADSRRFFKEAGVELEILDDTNEEYPEQAIKRS